MINGWNAVRYKDWFSAKTFKLNAFLLSHIDGNFYGRKMQDSVKAELGMLKISDFKCQRIDFTYQVRKI